MKKFFSVLFITFSVTYIANIMGQYLPDNNNIRYCGRIDFENPLKPRFISAGSYFTFSFTGTSCSITLDNENSGNGYNFISIECDGKYIGRIKVTKEKKKYQVVSGLSDDTHTLMICKATEAITGYIELQNIECRSILATVKAPLHRIEFIGNSITSGAEMDLSEYKCDSGNWHDRHNAYLAYGPTIARALNADWLLSSVSGMGLTRNWNNEGPALPAFYDNIYLNGDDSKKWDGKKYNPELISICLGTNDNSNGDNSYNRKPLDSTTFVNAYIQYIKHLRDINPSAIICLINSPVFDSDLRSRFAGYLDSIINRLKQEIGDQKIYSFSYQKKYEGGCGGHPNADEHKKMADELLPFFKNVTGW